MRRTAAALATVTLTFVALVGPGARAEAAATDPIVCGTAGPPVCALLDQLSAQLAPVQPVLDLAGPVLAQLGTGAQALAGLADAPGGVPSADVLQQVTALSGQLDALPAPIRNLLGATVLGGLTTTLDQISAALAPVTAPVLGTPSGGSGATPPPSSGSTPPPSGPAPAEATSSGGATGFGGAVSRTGDPGLSSTRSLPDIPEGSALSLAPLALPDFGFNPEFEATPAPLDAATADAATNEEIALARAADLTSGSGGSVGVIVAAFSALLLAAGLGAQALQARKAARTIPD